MEFVQAAGDHAAFGGPTGGSPCARRLFPAPEGRPAED